MAREEIDPKAVIGFYARYGKRVFDLVFSLFVSILLSPLLLISALCIRLDSPGPILFSQERLGRNGKIFQAIKFRTMTDRPRVPDREIMPRDPEITRIGYWLRRFKIDEWPQLINIFRGEMSVVGPRPALPRQLEEFDEAGYRRLLVKPGLTGLAQVHGNIYLSWPERWRYDAKYVDQLSFGLDLWIIFRTVSVMILGEKKFLQPPVAKNE